MIGSMEKGSLLFYENRLKVDNILQPKSTKVSESRFLPKFT